MCLNGGVAGSALVVDFLQIGCDHVHHRLASGRQDLGIFNEYAQRTLEWLEGD